MTDNSKHADLIAELLQPISELAPTGVDVENSTEYLQLEMEIRKKAPDYNNCVELASRLLREQGKHIRVIIYLTFAWYGIDKLPGLKDGLMLLLQALQKFGATLHPRNRLLKAPAIQALNNPRLLKSEGIGGTEDDWVDVATIIQQILSEIDRLGFGHLSDLTLFLRLIQLDWYLPRAKEKSNNWGKESESPSPTSAPPLAENNVDTRTKLSLSQTEQDVDLSAHTVLSCAEEPNDSPQEVLFKLYHPREGIVETWYSMLFYLHLAAADYEVMLDAKKFAAEMNSDPREVRSKKPVRLARGTKIRVVPSAEGVEFNPPEQELIWLEDFHRVSFRFRASSGLIYQPCFGEIAVYMGPVEIANIRFSVFFVDAAASPKEYNDETVVLSAQMYRKIFASYSHRDTVLVKACTTAFKALGDEVFIDYETLRSGENWSEALQGLIAKADVFQLFWSKNASESKYVEEEWRYALKQVELRYISKRTPMCTVKQEDVFIRPVYWERPLPQVPPELRHLHFKFFPEMAIENN